MHYRFTGVFCLLCFNLWSQNLVPNPGFEEFTQCPWGFSTNRKDFRIHGWESPTSGTPDHFNSCSTGDSDVPVNWAGNSNAHSGKGYAGVYVWTTGQNYREYLQGELAEPLRAGEKYIVAFYFKLANYSVYAVNRIGLAFSTERINVTHDRVLEIVPALSVEKDTAMTEATGSWEQARMEYVAKGGERFVVIGNFFTNQQTKATRLPFRYGLSTMLSTASYYYIDDVLVMSADSSRHPVVPGETIKLSNEVVALNHTYTLKDIKFEFDSYVIHPSSNDELNKVVAYLKAHPEVAIRLSGHTDSKGSDEYNLTLSRNRTKSIAEFLVSRGVEPDRIVSYGFGKSRPLRTDNTEEAAAVNRRVEIRFVSKE